jgi:hypothetical protein
MRFAPRSPQPSGDCSDPNFFIRNKTIPCEAWIYDPEEVTIHNEVGDHEVLELFKCASILNKLRTLKQRLT